MVNIASLSDQDITRIINRLAFQTELARKLKAENLKLRKDMKAVERRSRFRAGLPDIFFEAAVIRDMLGFKSLRAVMMAVSRGDLPDPDGFRKVRREKLGGGYDFLPRWQVSTIKEWLGSEKARATIGGMLRGE